MSEKVLGIDPGLTRCGFGLITKSASRQIKFLSVGVFQTPSSMEETQRISEVAKQVDDLLQLEKPDQVAIERVFSQQNLKSVISVAQISGAIVYLCLKRSIPVTFYTPTEVKAAVTGSGRASKDQVNNMVVKLLKLKEAPRPADAADALAIAITAAWRGSQSKTDAVETPAQRKWRIAEDATKQRRR